MATEPTNLIYRNQNTHVSRLIDTNVLKWYDLPLSFRKVSAWKAQKYRVELTSRKQFFYAGFIA